MNIAITRNKYRYLLAIIVSIFVAWQSFIYFSLTNPIKEMIYAETHLFNIWGLPRISTVYSIKENYISPVGVRVITLKEEQLDTSEKLLIYLYDEKQTMLVEYKKEFKDGTFLYMSYTYRDSIITESIEVTQSKFSKAFENIDNYSLSRNVQKDQSINKKEIITRLKEKQIDKLWLEEQSNYLLYDIVLKHWFENGSQRYSFDNLGNMEIVRDTLIENSDNE